MHSYCKNWVLLLNRWPFNVKCFGGIRIISIQRQCCSKMALKSRKKGSILGRNCRALIHLFLHYFFIFRALSKIRYVILNLGRVMQSFTGSYLIGSLFERWIIKIWMNSLWRPSSNNFIFGILVSDICRFHSLDRPFKHWNGMYITPNKAY